MFSVYSIASLWSRVEEFLSPSYSTKDIESSWANKSSEFLIKQLSSNKWNQSAGAGNILARRKDPDTIEPLINILKTSNNKDVIAQAIKILAEFETPEINFVLMGIVKNGRSHPNYLDAVTDLSLKHYEPIYPEILKMAEDNFETNLAIRLLFMFPNKLGTIQALETIANSDSKNYIRRNAQDTIKKIKAAQGK